MVGTPLRDFAHPTALMWHAVNVQHYMTGVPQKNEYNIHTAIKIIAAKVVVAQIVVHSQLTLK